MLPPRALEWGVSLVHRPARVLRNVVVEAIFGAGDGEGPPIIVDSDAGVEGSTPLRESVERVSTGALQVEESHALAHKFALLIGQNALQQTVGSDAQGGFRHTHQLPIVVHQAASSLHIALPTEGLGCDVIGSGVTKSVDIGGGSALFVHLVILAQQVSQIAVHRHRIDPIGFS